MKSIDSKGGFKKIEFELVDLKRADYPSDIALRVYVYNYLIKGRGNGLPNLDNGGTKMGRGREEGGNLEENYDKKTILLFDKYSLIYNSSLKYKTAEAVMRVAGFPIGKVYIDLPTEVYHKINEI